MAAASRDAKMAAPMRRRVKRSMRRASSSASSAGGSGDVTAPSPDWLIVTPYLSVVCSFATSSARNIVCVCLTFPATFGMQVFTSELDFAFQRGQTKELERYVVFV
ncbi:hypothetical protein ISCGN_030113 [Ixodes scapularis]